MIDRSRPLSGLHPELRSAILRSAHRRQGEIWPLNPWHAGMTFGFVGWLQRLIERPGAIPVVAIAFGVFLVLLRWRLSSQFDKLFSESRQRWLLLQNCAHCGFVLWLASWFYLGIRDYGPSYRSLVLFAVAGAVAAGALVLPPPATQLARLHVAILTIAVLAAGFHMQLGSDLVLAALAVLVFAISLWYLIEILQRERWLGFVAAHLAEERARELEAGTASLRHAFFSLEDEVRSRTEDLQKAISDYRAIFEGAHDAIVVFRPDDELILMANPTAGQMYGLPPEELCGRSLLEFSTDPARGRRHVAATLARESQYRFRTVHRRVDGKPLELEINASLIEHEGKPAILSLNRDLTVQREAEHLRLEKEAAERAAALKGQFLANVSHDIRTPVAGIIGLANLMTKEPLSQLQRERMELLQTSAEGLLRLLDDVLDLSRIEAGYLSVEQAPFRLLQPVRIVLDLVRMQAREKHLRLVIEPAPDLPTWVLGDESRIRQVLMNLVGNAVKFTQEGHVTVAVDVPSAGHVRFTVTDSGIGIPEAMRQGIFDPFSQGDPSTSRRFGGSGLGLSICRRLVERMGGTIDFSSRPGEGSKFWFSIPLPPVDTADSPPAGAGGPAIDESLANAARSRVLVVEDNEVSRLVLVEQLRLLGCSVEVASDGEGALRLVETESFSLVLLDLQMPGIDGFETARRMRAKRFPRHVPIVAVSAHAGSQEEAQCRICGIDRLMSKPVRDQELLDLLRACAMQQGAPESAAQDQPSVSASQEPSAFESPDNDTSQATATSEGGAATTARSEPAEPEILEPARVELLRKLGGARNRSLLRELAHNLSTDGAIRAAGEALGRGDTIGARRHVHSLKGSALNIGATRLAELAASVELQLDAGRPAGRLDSQLEQLQHLLEEAIAALEAAARP